MLAAPGPDWQKVALAFVETCQGLLWGPDGAKAFAWLHEKRSLSAETIFAAGLGYWPGGDGKDRGVVIPWWIDGDLWAVRIRRPAGKPKYQHIKGSNGRGLYNADAIRVGRPVVLVEGEIDALTINQHAGDLVIGVATGGVTGARAARWVARLAGLPSVVLVAFDADKPGDDHALWWVEALRGHARRWRPLWGDANAMAQDGADVRAWLGAALAAQLSPVPDRRPVAAPVLVPDELPPV